jgi:lysophospholipase L1-like esterase
MAQRLRWWPRLAGPALVVVTVLLAGQPALAAPSQEIPGSGAPAPPPVAAPGPDAAPPVLPPAVDVPGKGKVTPFTSKLAPTAPKALPGKAQAKGNTLDPTASTAKGSMPRRAAKPNGSPDDTPYLYCDERVQPSVSTQPPPANTATVSYTAEVGCNFYLYYGYGAAAVVDRTAGYDGTFLQISNPFEFYNSSYAGISGNTSIAGDYYGGGRQVEVIFELFLVTPYGIPWVACNPLVGLRYLLCDGLGTDVLHIVVGTGAFGTGLQAPPMTYTALGDSFSSGTGAPPYFGVQDCRRAPTAYAFDITGLPLGSGRRIGQPNLRACHGATVADLSRPNHEPTPQLADVTGNTKLVTVTIGGNDLGFGDKLKGCIIGSCSRPLLADSLLFTTKVQLSQLYRGIRGQMASDGYLFVLSYPQFLPNPDEGERPNLFSCFGTDISFSMEDLSEMARATRQVRDTIRDAVADAVALTGDTHIRFVDMLDVFRGHRICSTDEWSTGYRFPELGGSFHPNARGHQAIAERLSGEMNLFL